MKPLDKKKLVTYVALLRGINVGGNSLIKMSDLKEIFIKLGFSEVATYIASGNVIFKSPAEDQRAIEKSIEKALAKDYPSKPRVLVKSMQEIQRIVSRIPNGWGSPERRYNVIFLWPSIDSKKVLVGLNPKSGIEEVSYVRGALFWSANTSDLTRTAMVKLSSKAVYQEMTIRNLNTTRSIFELMQTSRE